MGSLASDVAIDIGSSSTRIYSRGRGVEVFEPTLVAVRRTGPAAGSVLAVGSEASRMLGRTPDDVAILSPVTGGAITNLDASDAMLRGLAPKRAWRWSLRRPRVVVAVPLDLSPVEQRAVIESLLRAGGREVVLVPKLMAAAVGLDLPLDRPTGHIIVDLGGGTTEIGVLALSGIVVSSSSRVGGADLTMALQAYVRAKLNLLIGEQTAERLKIQLGSAYPTEDMDRVEIRGRDLISGVPRDAEISREEVREALEEPVASIVAAVSDCLERTPPELSADLFERGILLVGGGSLLGGLDHRLREATGLAVVGAEDPLRTVVLGAGRILERPTEFRDLEL